MKMTLMSVGAFFLLILLFLAWAGWPWSLGGEEFEVEVYHVEPEGMVNNEDYPAVVEVLTWNLGFLYGVGSEGPGYEPRKKTFYESKLNELAQNLLEWQPDVVLLQEIDFDSSRSHGINQAQYLAAKANYPYVAEAVSWEANYVPFPYWPLSRQFGRLKSGGAILSKYPIVSHKVELLPKPASQPWWYNIFYLHRYFQTAEVEMGEKKIKLINLHLEAFDKADRKSQVESLLKKIKEEQVAIIAGDFNTVPLSASKKRRFEGSDDDYENDPTYEMLTGSGYLEVIPDAIYALDEARYFTFPSHRPDRRLDYIFYEPNLKMIKAEVLPSALSDHLPLRASFQIASPKFSPYSQ